MFAEVADKSTAFGGVPAEGGVIGPRASCVQDQQRRRSRASKAPRSLPNLVVGAHCYAGAGRPDGGIWEQASRVLTAAQWSSR